MATDNKYDRQLRLWGASGQKALGETTVVLVRATAAGTETLKNLVLPGLGAFVVVDSVLATAEDVSANFFTTATAESESAAMPPRAELAWQQLQELNPDVKGGFLHVTDGEGLASCVSSWEAWQASVGQKITATMGSGGGASLPETKQILVIGSDLEPPLKLALAQLTAAHGLDLIHVQSYGLLGTVRLQTATALPILNPKPRDVAPDLRLTTPFAALAEFQQQLFPDHQAWAALDGKQHKHVPYPLILLRIQQEYQAANGGALPRKFAEKQAFAQRIQEASRDYYEELNFGEATQNAYLAYNTESGTGAQVARGKLPELLQRAKEILETTSSATNPKLMQFAILLQALQQFLEQNNNQAPILGKIPDMTASTELYIQLQTIYKQKAEQDVAAMKALVAPLLAQYPGVEITDEELLTFCQNVFVLDWVPTRLLADEMNPQTAVPADLVEALQEAWQDAQEEGAMALMEAEDDDDKTNKVLEMMPLLWQLGLQACDLFYQQQGRYPGTDTDQFENDAPAVQKHLEACLNRYQLTVPDGTIVNLDKVAKELCRFGNAEVHNIAAVLGGVASQEAIKVITGQYVPLYHTYVYNGITSSAGVYAV